MVEKNQAKILLGDVKMDVRLAELFYNSLGPNPGMLPGELIHVQRDGERVGYMSTVIERVYLPPKGTGGRPYIRRTFFAWDRDNHRGLAIASDDEKSRVAYPTDSLIDESHPKHLWGRLGFVIESHNSGEAWMGVDGELQFEDAEVVGRCRGLTRPTAGAFPIPSIDDGEPVACEEVRVRINGWATLEKRRRDGSRGALDKWFTSKRQLRVESQMVSGSRIVTQCPEITLDVGFRAPMQCVNRYVFWRDGDQFASGLGLDVRELRSLQALGPNVYAQEIVAGNRGGFDCCAHYPGPARYVVSHPNGSVIARGEPAIAAKDSVLKRIDWFGVPFKAGSRTLLLMPALRFDRQLSQHALAVVDLTILACPAGSVHNDDITAVPDGSCYVPDGRPKPPGPDWPNRARSSEK